MMDGECEDWGWDWGDMYGQSARRGEEHEVIRPREGRSDVRTGPGGFRFISSPARAVHSHHPRRHRPECTAIGCCLICA